LENNARVIWEPESPSRPDAVRCERETGGQTIHVRYSGLVWDVRAGKSLDQSYAANNAVNESGSSPGPRPMPNGSCDDNVGNWDIREGYDEEVAGVDAQIDARSINDARRTSTTARRAASKSRKRRK
jgi:hypothetical protein